jgi:hypothetical protein
MSEEAGKKMMHQNYDGTYVTPPMCDLHHQLVESKLELLRQKDNNLEDKISAFEGRMSNMESKLDDLLKWQVNQFKLEVGIAVAVVLTLIGVILGRGLDFGLFL